MKGEWKDSEKLHVLKSSDYDPPWTVGPATQQEGKHNPSWIRSKQADVVALRQLEDTPSPSGHGVLKTDFP